MYTRSCAGHTCSDAGKGRMTSTPNTTTRGRLRCSIEEKQRTTHPRPPFTRPCPLSTVYTLVSSSAGVRGTPVEDTNVRAVEWSQTIITQSSPHANTHAYMGGGGEATKNQLTRRHTGQVGQPMPMATTPILPVSGFSNPKRCMISCRAVRRWSPTMPTDNAAAGSLLRYRGTQFMLPTVQRLCCSTHSHTNNHANLRRRKGLRATDNIRDN